MKSKWHIIRVFLLAGLMIFLYSFSNKRNQERELVDILVVFTNPEQLYVSMEQIQNLLVKDSVSFAVKDMRIEELEQEVLAHPMVADAEIYMSIHGVLGAEITQRTPVGRCVNATEVLYLDELGTFMPLSSNYSARVPLVYGVEDSLSSSRVMPLLLALREDDFMKQSVTAIAYNKQGDISLQMRQNSLDIRLGKPEDLEHKFRKLKGFIKYIKDKNTLEEYKAINLQYENQVVATKK